MATTGRLPNLIIAGVGKAGTTSLFRYLGQHPDICPSDVKELGWFLTPPGVASRPLAEYAAHFAGCDGARYALEASPGYFARGTPVVAALQEHLDDPRVVVSLRDPVSRLWSHYRFLRSTGQIDADVTVAEYVARGERFAAETDDPGRASPYAGVLRGRYAEFLDVWHDAFGDRLAIVFFEQLVARPADEVAGLLRWLDLDPAPAVGFDYDAANQTMEHRSTALRDAKRAVLGRTDRWLRRHPRVRRGLRRAYRAVNEAPPAETDLPDDVRRRLEELYGPANARLAEELRGMGVTALPPWLARAATS